MCVCVCVSVCVCVPDHTTAFTIHVRVYRDPHILYLLMAQNLLTNTHTYFDKINNK